MLLCLGLTAAGCGGSDNQSSTDRQASTDLTTGVNVARREVEGVAKPANPVPKGPPPKKLAVRDLIVGKGPPAKVGDTIKLEYIGIGWNGRPFSDSWT